MSRPEEKDTEHTDTDPKDTVDIPHYEPTNRSTYLDLFGDKGINDNSNSPPYYGR